MLKMIGIVLIISACSGVGFTLAATHRREEKSLRQLIGILDFMECELQYRLTPLPNLCKLCAREFPQTPGKIFGELADEMEQQIFPDIACCMRSVLDRTKDLPSITRRELLLFGKSVGRFDLEGQLKGLEGVRQDCRRNLERLGNNRDNRLRSYQTLGLCAGAALAILLI